MRLALAAASCALVAASMPPTVSADEGGTATAGSSSANGVIAATAGRETTGGLAASSAAVSKPRCEYFPFDMATTAIAGEAPVGPARRDATTKEISVGGPAGQNTETLYTRLCPGQAPDYVWAADAVDVDALIASAHQSVTARVPAPSMNMNPDPAVGGVVNIGLWLAVADPGQVSITASVGPVWATVTARYRGTTWSMGNGDVVECDGLGTPIVDVNTADQGPCGYTYRWPSAPKFSGTYDLAYHDSVTGHWVVTYATSTGRSGTLAPIDRATQFSYRVREIQTVRVDESG